ncbi:MAG: dTMP kinase [Spirochaetaceae bacterium]|nr:dTMP kinase [Spirochaetaceae bacterium]
MNSNKEIWERMVAVEGIDGAGTTTLTRNLGKALSKQNIPYVTGCEPTDGDIGKIIRAALSGKQPVKPKTLALLFAADRREHLYSPNGILNDINSEKIYITDRYFFSSLAYQSLDADWDWVKQLNDEYPLPGYLIYLGLPVEEAQKRISIRDEREIFEKADLQHRVSESYLKSIEAYRNQGMKILELDSREKAEDVCDAAIEFIKELF